MEQLTFTRNADGIFFAEIDAREGAVQIETYQTCEIRFYAYIEGQRPCLLYAVKADNCIVNPNAGDDLRVRIEADKPVKCAFLI